MKKLWLSAGAVILALSSLAGFAWAHGGAERALGDQLVSLQQVPLSPLTGERTQFYIDIHDRQDQPAVEAAYHVQLLKPDGLERQVLVDQTLKTSTHGRISFDHRFNEEGIYILRVSPSGQPVKAEFVLQVRRNLIAWPIAAGFAVTGFVAGWAIAYLSRPRRYGEAHQSFELQTSRLSRWLTGSRPRAEIIGSQLLIHWGPWVSAEADLGQLSQARRSTWNWWYGIGVHWSRGHLFINGTREQLMTLSFEVPQRARALGINLNPTKITINPKDPETFQQALDRISRA